MPKKKSNSKNKKKTPAAKVDAGGDPTSIFAPTPDTSGIDIDKPLRSYQGQGSEKHAYDGGGKHTYDGGIRDGRPHQLFPPGIVVFSQEALSATLATRQGHAQDELAAQRRALCEAQRKGYLSYELFAEYNEAQPDFPMAVGGIQQFASRYLLTSLLWGMGGSLSLEGRASLGAVICSATAVGLPAASAD